MPFWTLFFLIAPPVFLLTVVLIAYRKFAREDREIQ